MREIRQWQPRVGLAFIPSGLPLGLPAGPFCLCCPLCSQTFPLRAASHYVGLSSNATTSEGPSLTTLSKGTPTSSNGFFFQHTPLSLKIWRSDCGCFSHDDEDIVVVVFCFVFLSFIET